MNCRKISALTALHLVDRLCFWSPFIIRTIQDLPHWKRYPHGPNQRRPRVSARYVPNGSPGICLNSTRSFLVPVFWHFSNSIDLRIDASWRKTDESQPYLSSPLQDRRIDPPPSPQASRWQLAESKPLSHEVRICTKLSTVSSLCSLPLSHECCLSSQTSLSW